jgi:hypothetical protein
VLVAKKKTMAAILGLPNFRESDSPWAFVKNQKPMKRKSALRNFLALAGSSLIAMPSANAATIANWKEMNPALSGTNSGMNTNSPTIGNGTAENADDAWVAGRFGTVASPESVTLSVGQTLTVSGSVTFTGGLSGTATQLNQFRFGVFDGGADFASDTTTWANGGWINTPTGSNAGIYQAATTSNFLTNNTNAVLLTSTTDTTNGNAFNADSTTPYNWSFTITRDSLTTVDLAASLTGGLNAVNFARTVDNRTTTLFTYSTVGLLFGGGMNLDQGALSNVQYNVIPEPRTALLGGLGMLVLLRRRGCT